MRQWITYECRCLNRPVPNLDYFFFTGFQLCQLSEEDFRMYAPASGNDLYFTLFNWKTGVYHSVADPDEVHLTPFPPPPPPPPFLNILWKWNNLVSVRANYFIFMGYSRKMRLNQQSDPPYTYEPPLKKSWTRPWSAIACHVISFVNIFVCGVWGVTLLRYISILI